MQHIRLADFRTAMDRHRKFPENTDKGDSETDPLNNPKQTP